MSVRTDAGSYGPVSSGGASVVNAGLLEHLDRILLSGDVQRLLAFLTVHAQTRATTKQSPLVWVWLGSLNHLELDVDPGVVRMGSDSIVLWFLSDRPSDVCEPVWVRRVICRRRKDRSPVAPSVQGCTTMPGLLVL
jgi:hypothetical protein